MNPVHEHRSSREGCIVRQWAGEKAVSRYNYCIVTEAR